MPCNIYNSSIDNEVNLGYDTSVQNNVNTGEKIGISTFTWSYHPVPNHISIIREHIVELREKVDLLSENECSNHYNSVNNLHFLEHKKFVYEVD